MPVRPEDAPIRLLIREVLIQESVFDSIVHHLRKRFGSKYEGALNAINVSKFPDPSMLASMRDQDIEYILRPMADSWFGKLGTAFGYDINFHKLLDGKNNYRGAIRRSVVEISPEFFKRLNRDYSIKRVVTLNSEEEDGRIISSAVEEAGLESIYVPFKTGEQPTTQQFDEIISALSLGDTLVQCTNGADRTGAVVARYYIENLNLRKDRAVEDAKAHGFDQRYQNLMSFLAGETSSSVKKVDMSSARPPAAADASISPPQRAPVVTPLPAPVSVPPPATTTAGPPQPAAAPVAAVSTDSRPLPSYKVANINLKGLEDRFYKYDESFRSAAEAYSVPFSLLKAIGIKESKLKIDTVSRRGAQGIMQIMPRTARSLGLSDPFDPEKSIMAAAKLLREELDRFGGSVELAVAAYNSGSPNVRKAISAGHKYAFPSNKETIDYVPSVLELRDFIKDWQPNFPS